MLQRDNLGRVDPDRAVIFGGLIDHQSKIAADGDEFWMIDGINPTDRGLDIEGREGNAPDEVSELLSVHMEYYSNTAAVCDAK